MRPKTKGYPHQDKEFKRHVFDRHRALMWQMRTGKTKMAIDTACALYQGMEISGVVVVAPNGIHRQWAEEQIPRHAWGPTHTVFPWRFSDSKNMAKFKMFMEAWKVFDGLHWLMLNTESLVREEVRKAIEQFMRAHPDFLLIVDESHQFGTPGAKRTSWARALARRASYTRILTGTPVENRPLQAWSQFELLAPGILGYRTYGDFCADYAVYADAYGAGGRRFQQVVGYKNIDKLKSRMAPYSSVVLREDCEGLPTVQYETVLVEMGLRQTAAWKALKNEIVEELLAMNLGPEAIQGGVKLNKLQQVESGFLNTDEGVLEFERPKMQALLNEIVCHNSVVICWFRFTKEIEYAKVFLEGEGLRVAMYHGKMSDKARGQSLALFKSGKLDAFLAQPESAGQGRDLGEATKMVWHGQTPDAIWRSQADERATRVGGRSTQIVDIIVKGGVCEYYRSLTRRKTSLADDLARVGLREVLNQLEV